jgi:hypothetical protein
MITAFFVIVIFIAITGLVIWIATLAIWAIIVAIGAIVSMFKDADDGAP